MEERLVVDLGHRNGEGLADLRAQRRVKLCEGVHLLLFEANPRLYAGMVARARRIEKNTGARVVPVCAAAWERDGYVRFEQRGKGEGESGWGSNIDGLRDKETGEKILNYSEVACFDTGPFIARYCWDYGIRGPVQVKMDIEGAEFAVLDSIGRAWECGGRPEISELWVEFHSRYMKGKTRKDELDAIARAEGFCTTVREWK